MIMNIIGLVGWAGGWVLLLVVSTYTPDWVVWAFMPYFLYGAYRVLTQCKYFASAFLMLRVLRAYPWQILRSVPRGLTRRPDVVSEQYGWFEFPNPAFREQPLPLVFPRHLRRSWWARRMAPRAKPHLKAQIETLWFAGDPRFIGLVAAPARRGTAPRRLHVLEQRMHVRSGWRFADWGATPDDIERGRRAGVRPVQP
ncbi:MULTISPECIES: hypothetical protein [Streptomyces]|uniref:Uncharacterized protein n=2 Tax=Streptomyces rochei TaxID=1928 RepID=A0AAX3ZN64_STRRO|nr:MULTISPECIES: hypothetical protein [Streptomyces]RSS05914.1 hypothetical protein EF913_01840 [Streptomyces sp. WAC04189]RSS22891.1 hypothetical protein EF914_12585 [Streptomyces sp. WAC05458]RSS77461.1 hypothetical protein EF911_02990 [Streptomyces sp. WAC06128]RSS96478.1 hypothetical protein EF919_05960 [Streptomyces sp. WAC02707]WMC88305.1 hypothetical protein P7W03_23230 [Streptomyces rochei]